MEQYLIHNLGNDLDYPEPHMFFKLENAIARARVVEGKTMGVYQFVKPHGKRLEAITHNGKVFTLAETDSTETDSE
jgi:hypothetical protein